MDDKEYYSLMNRSSSWALQQALKKNNNSKKASAKKGSSTVNSAISAANATSYTTLEARQGKADAEMLMEKAEL